jgi:hypothetical protein
VPSRGQVDCVQPTWYGRGLTTQEGTRHADGRGILILFHLSNGLGVRLFLAAGLVPGRGKR